MQSAMRYLVSLVTAFVLISGMFFFMHRLITEHGAMAQLQSAARIEFSRLRRDSEVKSRREEKAKMQTTAAPPTPQLAAITSFGAGAAVMGVPVKVQATAVVTTQKIKLEKMQGGSDRDVVPLVRIEPEYPMMAAQQRIEGWVLLRFNITPVGTVKDARVIDSNPKAIFDETSVKAVMRWKYNPKIENGVAVERRGVEVILRFNLEKK